MLLDGKRFVTINLGDVVNLSKYMWDVVKLSECQLELMNVFVCI